jgi:hypothetical protein
MIETLGRDKLIVRGGTGVPNEHSRSFVKDCELPSPAGIKIFNLVLILANLLQKRIHQTQEQLKTIIH